MAQNPYVNKVVFGNDTLVDLTEDSVTASNLLEGETAHNAAGAPVTGTAKQGHIIWNAIKTALSPQRLKLWFADAKVTDDSTEQATKVEVVQLIDDESELTNAPDGVYQGDYEDAPEDILNASMVAYKDGSVEDALDITDNTFSITYNADKVTGGVNPTCVRIGNIGLVSGYFMTKTALVSDDVIFTITGVTPLKRTITSAYKNNGSNFFVIKSTANSQNITVDTTPSSATANNEYYLYNMILLLAD